MSFEEELKAQRIIIAIALILMSLISFNFAVKGTITIISFIIGLAFLGMALFLLFGLKKKHIGERKPNPLKPRLPDSEKRQQGWRSAPQER